MSEQQQSVNLNARQQTVEDLNGPAQVWNESSRLIGPILKARRWLVRLSSCMKGGLLNGPARCCFFLWHHNTFTHTDPNRKGCGGRGGGRGGLFAFQKNRWNAAEEGIWELCCQEELSCEMLCFFLLLILVVIYWGGRSLRISQISTNKNVKNRKSGNSAFLSRLSAAVGN